MPSPAFQRIFRFGIAAAVAAILAAVAVLIGLSLFWRNEAYGGLAACTIFFLVIAVAVAALTYLGIQYTKYHENGDTQESASWTYTPSPSSDHGSIIMLAATIIFLVAGFVFDAWHFAWIICPVGGLLCGMVGGTGRK